jgi:hypothetical protein
MATRFRHALGTVMVTAFPARTTSPHFVQYRHGRRPVGTICSMYAGGTETIPSTIRLRYRGSRLPWYGNAVRSMISAHGTVREGGGSADRAPTAAAPTSATAARTSVILVTRLHHLCLE